MTDWATEATIEILDSTVSSPVKPLSSSPALCTVDENDMNDGYHLNAREVLFESKEMAEKAVRELKQRKPSHAPWCDLVLAQLSTIQDQTTVSIKYVGFTVTVSACDRVVQDGGEINSLVIDFCGIARGLGATIEVHEVVDARVQGLDSISLRLRPDVFQRETALVALFGPGTLLNSAPGGLFPVLALPERTSSLVAAVNDYAKTSWDEQPAARDALAPPGLLETMRSSICGLFSRSAAVSRHLHPGKPEEVTGASFCPPSLPSATSDRTLCRGDGPRFCLAGRPAPPRARRLCRWILGAEGPHVCSRILRLATFAHSKDLLSRAQSIFGVSLSTVPRPPTSCCRRSTILRSPLWTSGTARPSTFSSS